MYLKYNKKVPTQYIIYTFIQNTLYYFILYKIKTKTVMNIAYGLIMLPFRQRASAVVRNNVED